MVDPDMERKDAEIDDEVGVAVLFDEEQVEEDEEGRTVGKKSLSSVAIRPDDPRFL
jgi:hypothetical protein